MRPPVVTGNLSPLPAGGDGCHGPPKRVAGRFDVRLGHRLNVRMAMEAKIRSRAVTRATVPKIPRALVFKKNVQDVLHRAGATQNPE